VEHGNKHVVEHMVSNEDSRALHQGSWRRTRRSTRSNSSSGRRKLRSASPTSKTSMNSSYTSRRAGGARMGRLLLQPTLEVHSVPMAIVAVLSAQAEIEVKAGPVPVVPVIAVVAAVDCRRGQHRCEQVHRRYRYYHYDHRGLQARPEREYRAGTLPGQPSFRRASPCVTLIVSSWLWLLAGVN
jgi:hypothetical protein